MQTSVHINRKLNVYHDIYKELYYNYNYYHYFTTCEINSNKYLRD